jgi:transcriptional regulator with XRE-family HTH domain/mannose-6-phosphate isomerase-like protein (cupin superfamily)
MSEQSSPDVGNRLRSIRQRRGLSLRALAELSGLSPNTISLIERGITSPSVSTLHQLATALGVVINAFFVEPQEITTVILTRAGERIRSGSASVVLESLGYGLEGQACDPFVVVLKPGANSGRQVMIHTGTELVHCLEGQFHYEIADEQFKLGPGDTLLFRAEQPHRWHNPYGEPATFLLMMSVTEQREESVEQHLHP